MKGYPRVLFFFDIKYRYYTYIHAHIYASMAKGDSEAIMLAEIRKMYVSEYMATLNIPPKLKNILGGIDVGWSHQNRIVRNLQRLKYLYTLSKSNIISTCFKVSFDTTSSIYGFIYFRCISGPRGYTMEPEFICTGPTFRSQDGEFRSRVIPYEQMHALFDKYSSVFAIVEEMIVSKLTSGKLSFQTDFYYPMNCGYDSKRLEDFINSNRLPIKMYILCWIHDFYSIHNKIMENHANQAYQYIIYQSDDIPVFDLLITKLGKGGYGELTNRIAHCPPDISSPQYNIQEIQCGQKIFPLTVIEAMRPDDINFNVWREIYITNLASNLVLNLISPSFPIINNWFYIQNAHAGLFDNVAMHDKYDHSEIATEVSTQLKNIDKYNYVAGEKKKGPVSNEFYRLSYNIHKSIVYADSDIRITDLALCMTTEYVGRTMRDIPTLITHKEHLPGLDRVFTDLGLFSKHMFEFIYGFYCMNTKAGIVHGDLHMNNCTIFRLYAMLKRTGEPYIKSPKITYVVGETAYVFDHVGLFSMIIDFSRAILGDYKKIEHEFSPRFAEAYFREQELRIAYLLYQYFPDLMNKYKDKIKELIHSNFPLMFKIITAIDTFVIMSNITAMFSVDDAFTRGKVKIAPGVMKLLNKLSTRADELVIENISAMIEGRITSPDDIEWPNRVIIEEIFASHVMKVADTTITITEVFNSNNDMNSDIDDYDTWGSLLSLDGEEVIRKKHKIPFDPESYKQWVKFKGVDESIPLEDLTKKYELMEKDVLEFEPWMIL